jgi:hypothetical protein
VPFPDPVGLAAVTVAEVPLVLAVFDTLVDTLVDEVVDEVVDTVVGAALVIDARVLGA